ncbi:fimbrial assembly protein [Silvibacterium acidisoli]|uniref:fimbrial assembly protein n=1 Tax=Acidobacteriaceae bacterium ZG23-2 TaxID=2883246 RepID=UPI00406CBF67
MKISINLASQPYVDVRSIVKRCRILMLIFVLITIPLMVMQKSAVARGRDAMARVASMNARVAGLERQQQNYEAMMRQPNNAATLTQADFLNSLFAQKSFSWTATMTDLETVLPGGVQVLSLDPEITKSGEIIIRLRVSGARDRGIELIHNLEKSRHFASPRLADEALAQTSGPQNALQPISASTLVNFDILADYKPLTEKDTAESDKAPHAESKRGKK